MLEFKSKTECIFGASFLEAGTCVLHAFLQPKCQFLAKNLSIPGGGGYHIYIYIYAQMQNKNTRQKSWTPGPSRNRVYTRMQEEVMARQQKPMSEVLASHTCLFAISYSKAILPVSATGSTRSTRCHACLMRHSHLSFA